MSLPFSLGNLVILVGGIQGLFLSLVLWNLQYGKKTSHRLLAAFLFFFSLSMLGFVVWDSETILQYPHLSMVVAPTEILLGPLFYLYTRSLTKKEFVMSGKEWLHFIPLLFVILYFIPFYVEPAAAKVAFNKESYVTLPSTWMWFSIFSTVYNTIYLLLSMLVIEKHRRTIRKYYSSVDKVNLRWIQLLFAFCVIAFFCCVVLGIVGFKWSNYFSNIIFSACIYAMGYYGMKQREIFSDFRETVETEEPEPAIIRKEDSFPKKYEKSGLTEERAHQLLTSLDNIMRKEKLFLQPDLNLQQLADALSLQITGAPVSIHHLSQVLNQYKQQNFFDYVNALRVEEFKRLLPDANYRHLSLLGLALECGFNSKASFNLAFKKHMGITPSAYRQELNPGAT